MAVSTLVPQQQEIEGETGGSLSKLLAEIQGQRSHKKTEIVAPKPIESRLPMRRSTNAMASFGVLKLGPRETKTTSLMLQYYFKANKIIVVESTPNATAIDSLFVGSLNQFSGRVMSAVFAGDAFGNSISMDTIQPGMTVSITATNLTDQSVNVSASLFGDTLR